MSQATCIALSAVFPLLLVTMAIEHRRVIRDVRRHQRVFNWIVESGMLAALVGLVVTVTGVQTDGVDKILGFAGWAAFAWSVFVLFGYLLWIVLQDREDHAAASEREREAQRRERDDQARLELEAIEAARRSRVWWRRSGLRSRDHRHPVRGSSAAAHDGERCAGARTQSGQVDPGGPMGDIHEAAQQMLSEARDDVKHADQKASLILAALGIGFGAVLGGQLAGDFDSGNFSIVGQVVWWVGIVLAIAAVSLAVLAVWPRYTLDDRPQYGITYWGHVAAFKTLGDFEEALDDADVSSRRRTNHQLWRLSRLVLLKYRFVRAALVFGGLSALGLGVAAIVIR